VAMIVVTIMAGTKRVFLNLINNPSRIFERLLFHRLGLRRSGF
jgi:hypothetical protein